MLLTSAGAGVGSATAATVCGDADGDGVVTITDGVRILRVAAELDPACATGGCDVDGTGQVTVTDAVLALRRAAGLDITDACGGGTIAGRLLIPPASSTGAAAIVEQEPNDGPRAASVAGWIASGETRRVAGTVGADDSFDGWVFVAGRGLALDLTLTFLAEPDVDLDLFVDDRHGGSVACEHTTPGREHCRVAVGSASPAPFDVVVTPASGSRPAAYELVVSARATTTPIGVTARAGAGDPIDVAPAVYRGDAAESIPGEVLVQLAPSSAGAVDDPLPGIARRTLAATSLGDGLRIDAIAPDGTRLVTLPAIHASATAVGVGPDAALAAKRARGAARRHTAEVAAALLTDPAVRLAEPHRVVRAARVPRDPLYPRQWHLGALGLPRAWDVTIGSASTIVAVVDTGIRSDHPDLAGRLVPGFDFITNATRANDGDGLDPDPFDPGDAPSSPEGGSFHGTHVAGTIAAATDGTVGVAGVTWRTGIMPLRVLGVGGGSVFDVAQAVRFAAGLSNTSGTVPPVPARVINLSLATSGDDPVLRSAIDAATDAGALVVAAAGNTGSDGFLSPAAFPNVLSIAATDRLGAPPRYSSFGASVDLAAPGGDTHADRDVDGFPDGVLSTLLPGRVDYALLQGTSMAAAHASGVAALLLGVPGGASAQRLREVLIATADDRGAPGRDDHYGAGIIDAARAVRMLAGLPEPTSPALTLVTSTARVESEESVLHVPFRNDGGGTLVLATPAVTTDDGIPWLAVDLELSALRLEIDRDALGPGVYTGRVDLASNGGAGSLTVVAEVAAEPPADVGPVSILLRDVATQAIVATTTTTVAESYRYRFDDVAPGTYEILATTDRDGDGALCDLGESCGAYPSLHGRLDVTVTGGHAISARDFPLELVVSEKQSDF